MCHVPDEYVKFFKLLKRVLPKNRVKYDFSLKMDGGWVRRRDDQIPSFITGAKARLKIGGKEVAYVTDVKYTTIDVAQAIEVLDEN